MRIGREENITIFAGQEAGGGARAQETAKNGNRKAVFVGEAKFAETRDLISQKKADAQKKAMKIVGDTFSADRTIDDDMEARREKVRALKQEKLESQKQIDWYNGEQERLKDVYGVTDDSEEAKELELLRKCNDPEGGATGEERKLAEDIRKRGLTEYQSRQLELDEAKKPYRDKIEENDRLIEQENRTLEAIRLERLKKDPMVDAQKEAQDILKEAAKEIVGMVVDDAKENLDEEKEKREEEGEKIRDERREQEALIEKRKEKREEMEELLEDMPMEEMLRLDQLQTDVQQEIQGILNKMKLVPEDIKGAAVDEKR